MDAASSGREHDDAGLDPLSETLHEANNLLQAIAVEAKLVMDDVGRLASEPQPLLARIIDQTLEVSRVLARLQATGWAEPLRPTTVAALIEAALSVAGPRATNAEVTLEVALAPDLPTVTARATQLTHVVVNLLVNAVQAVAARGRSAPDRRVRLSASALQGPPRVRLSVWDDGVGVPEAVRRLLFTTHVTTKARGEGLGVGLLVSKRIVEEHGGTLVLESRPGEFTEVTVDLPAGPPD